MEIVEVQRRVFASICRPWHAKAVIPVAPLPEVLLRASGSHNNISQHTLALLSDHVTQLNLHVSHAVSSAMWVEAQDRMSILDLHLEYTNPSAHASGLWHL